MIRSAAAKLTLWYLGIIMVLSSLFSAALYNESVAQLYDNATRQHDAIERLPLPRSLEPRRDQLNELLDEEVDSGKRHLVVRLLLLNALTLALGGWVSYLLARRTLKPIQESLEAQGRFTADASHELRTPLTAMRSEIEVALRDSHLNATEARDLLSSNLEEIAKLEALSAGLLRLARSDGNLDPSAIAAVPASEIFEGAIDRFQIRLDQRHIKLEVQTGAETIEGDRASLIELIAILLDNAIKYSPEKSTITLRSEPQGGGLVRLSVTDEGIGIKASDLPHIFHRFYRADRSRSKEHISGYGLGLSIAERITDIHHGAIAVQSVPGKGSTFKVKLPVKYVPKKSAYQSLI